MANKYERCSAGGTHEFPSDPAFNQILKCPSCGHLYAWFGFWAEIG